MKMMKSELATHRTTKDILARHQFRLSKSLGQNFLVDTNILTKIVDAAELTKEDIVFEVGTGIGTLTRELAKRAGRVVAIEIDKDLIPILGETLADTDNVSIINQDILKTDLAALAEEYAQGKKIKVVANLPYYITTAIIMKFLESTVAPDRFVLMIQRRSPIGSLPFLRQRITGALRSPFNIMRAATSLQKYLDPHLSRRRRWIRP